MQDASKRLVGKLFAPDVQYVIPTFQRPYVWDRERQWEPLWEDIRATAERLEEATAAAGGDHEAAEKATGKHFLGAVVLQQVQTAAATLEKRNVIDGQQRMTTLQLLLDAAQAVVAEDGATPSAIRLRKLVLNDRDIYAGDELFKLWPAMADRAAFRAAMDDAADEEPFADARVVAAHRFFREQIREWLDGGGDRAARGQSLYVTLANLLEVVVIDLRSDDDAHVIFETLNARGTPLLASDLVKNYLLHLADARGAADRLHADHWTGFESPWWREDVSQGRLSRPRVDVLLNYWLAARTRKEVASHRVFKALQDHVEETGAGPEEIAADFAGAGAAYRTWADDPPKFPPTGPEGTFFYRWGVIQAGVLTPVLLVLFAASPEEISDETRRRTLAVLESYLVRRLVCPSNSKDYNRLFLDLIERLDGRLAEADRVTAEFLAGQTATSRVWPDDAAFTKAILERPVYRLLSRGRTRMVLEALEDEARTPKSEAAHVARGELTVEHVLPRKWRKHWPLPPAADPREEELAAARRDDLKDTLGNLSMISGRLNSSVSNGPWEKKRAAFGKHSVLHLNKRLLDDWEPSATPEENVAARGAKLAAAACRVWPRPDGG